LRLMHFHLTVYLDCLRAAIQSRTPVNLNSAFRTGTAARAAEPIARPIDSCRDLLLVAIALAFVAAQAGSCQAPSPQSAATPKSNSKSPMSPIFDVAAIHRNTTDQSGRSHIVSSSSDGRFTAINVTLKSLLQWAFAIPDTRILDGPAWID